MNLSSNKYIHKVISLLIKACILILCIYYIIEKLWEVNISLNIKEILPKINSAYFYTAFVLVFFNWGIEAKKWKYLIQKLEYISFSTAIKSILSGVTISIFTPNRVGEFAGRIFYLNNTDKIKATLISLIGSLFQLIVTIIIGFIACVIYYQKHKNEAIIFNSISTHHLFYLLVVFAFILISLIVIYFNDNSISKKIKEILKLYSTQELSYVFILSLLRYFVFSFQYYLMLLTFGVDLGIINCFLLIAIIFLVTSAIPTFALTEITVRGASSVFFFSLECGDSVSIISASLILWIINLGIPALVGGAFIWNLNFFKTLKCRIN
jgi:uncharacterized membrane protein YbhN (UPF0104 family)